MRHQSYYSPSEGMHYWVQPSRSSSPGGRDGEWEIIRAYHTKMAHKWNLDNMMIALIKDERIAEQTAKLMAAAGVVKLAIPDPLPEETTEEKRA